MSQSTEPRWHTMRTDESRVVENTLREAGFERVDAYRYNPGSIRVRVIDPRFENLSEEDRADLVEPYLQRIPEDIRRKIIMLLPFAPRELESLAQPTTETYKYLFLNAEFEDPRPSLM